MPRFFRIFRKKLRLRARRQYLLARAIRRGRALKPVQDRTRRIRPGDILLAHLGIHSRHDPWAPAVLEPLIVGLKSTGFCFATLREHPAYRSHLARS